ncbi:MAG: sugar transferase [Muribaculaceae bacterium]|nr:sugar transferase [Muribaculaceae bacterium]
MRIRYVVMDLITSSLAFFLFNGVRYVMMGMAQRYGISFLDFISTPKMILEQCLIPLAMLGVFWMSGYYNHPFGKSRLQELSQTIGATLFNTMWIYLALLINDQLPTRYFNYELLILLLGLLFSVTYLGRIILTQASIYNLENRNWAFNTVIIGNSPHALADARRLDKAQTRLGYNIIGFIPIPGESTATSNHKILTRRQLETLCRQGNVDNIIIIAEQDSSEKKILSLLYEYFHLGVPIRIRPSALDYVTSKIRTGDIYAEPFIDISSPSMSDSQINIKRVIDVVLSILALIVMAPLMFILALIVRFTSPGPVIYRQERIGYRQKPFQILKFRSMREDAEKSGPQLSSDNDTRITPIGRVMRKYRLDEVPQFWNVLKGEMSLVGPRPERKFYIDKIVGKAPHYSLLHQVKPGITSWGMVKYGYAGDTDKMIERSYYDLIYLSNMSVIVDFKILLHTISTVIGGRGV